MLPDCNIIVPTTIRMGKNWRTAYSAYFKLPDKAEAQLKSDGLNYFFVSMDLPFYPFFPELFSPTGLRTHLAVRWTDGRNYLLTWPGPDTTPIDDKFMAFYTKGSGADLVVPCTYEYFADQCAILHYLEKHEKNLRPFAFPWCLNCAGLPRIGK